MKIYTIGYTKKTAEEFFGALEQHGVQRVVDVRLKNTSQLAGFTKKQDLEYFLHLLGIEYCHLELLAPTPELMKAYRDSGEDWDIYVAEFSRLLEERDVLGTLDREFFSEKRSCLLCSEPEAEHCHRRLVAEHLQGAWAGVEIEHL
jgi:uncharacterized protein (DUF488 family)